MKIEAGGGGGNYKGPICHAIRPVQYTHYCKSTKFSVRFNFANFAILANSQN